MSKRIFVDLLNFSTPEIAGVGVFARNLLGTWFSGLDESYAITCCSIAELQPAQLFGFTESARVNVRKVNVKRLIARLAYQHLIVPFLLRKYDLYYNPAVGLPFLARLISPKTKLVVTIHDMAPFYYSKKYTFFRSILVKILSKYAAKAAHCVVTVSENSKKDLVEIASLESSKVHVIYNFMAPPFALGNAQDKKYFLCISTIEPGKNMENTIVAYAKFRRDSKFKEYEFNWIGRIGWGTSEEQVRALIKNQDVEDSFHWIGYVTEAEKRKWLENCTALVYMSHYEGFGLPVLEGLTVNKPSVASNNSSLPEVVGDAGILCDPLDTTAIARAMEEMVLHADRFKARIPDQLKRFDRDREVGKFAALIQTLLAQTR